ncbi:DNA cytosine methyltransferase [Streptomyces formicae]
MRGLTGARRSRPRTIPSEAGPVWNRGERFQRRVRATGTPRLISRKARRIPSWRSCKDSPNWMFTGSKTSVYQQVGNAFPPPMARAVDRAIAAALDQADVSPSTNATDGRTA